MKGPIESKVAWPAAAVFCSSILCSALYALVLEYNLLEPTDGQHTAIIGFGASLQYVLYVVVGYYAPHTPRPDLPEHDQAFLEQEEKRGEPFAAKGAVTHRPGLAGDA